MAKKTETEKTQAIDGATKPVSQPVAKATDKINLPGWLRSRKIQVGLAILIVAVVATTVFLQLNKPEQTNTDDAGTEEKPSLAHQLENIEFDEGTSQADKDLNYLSVAAAYMSEGNNDKALEQYLLAESAGIVGSRLYMDVATIYNNRGDTQKQDEYLTKAADFLKSEIENIQDELSLSGDYVILGSIYEELGDMAAAKSSYQTALTYINKVSTKDSVIKAEIQETKSYLEEKINEI